MLMTKEIYKQNGRKTLLTLLLYFTPIMDEQGECNDDIT